MNPGGYAQEVLWTDQTRKDSRDHWRELYVWNPTGEPATKAESDLGPEQRNHVQRIESHAFAEVIDIVFASARRSLEALRISLATTDRLSFAAPSPLVQETADGVIQVLGSRRSRLSTHDANALQNIPHYVAAYIHAVAQKNGVAPQTLERQVLRLFGAVRRAFAGAAGRAFCRCTLLCPSRGAVLRLSAVPPGTSAPGRRRVRRVPGGSRRAAAARQTERQPPAAAERTNDYYNFLPRKPGNYSV